MNTLLTKPEKLFLARVKRKYDEGDITIMSARLFKILTRLLDAQL